MAGKEGFGSWRHLAGRFFGALSPAGPAETDEQWALGLMVEGETALWKRMSGPDRRHAVQVAKDVALLLGRDGPGPAREVLAAALFHDAGKVEAGLGTFARVGVTLAAIAFSRERMAAWAGKAAAAGLRRRVGLYLAHDKVGARLLETAGSDTFTIAWAREHHLPVDRWSVDHRLGTALKTADGD